MSTQQWITALSVRKESCSRSNYHKNSFIAAIDNSIKQAKITFPKEPWPRTLSNSNCEGSALRQALELMTSFATSMREDASSTGCWRQEGKKWACDRSNPSSEQYTLIDLCTKKTSLLHFYLHRSSPRPPPKRLESRWLRFQDLQFARNWKL